MKTFLQVLVTLLISYTAIAQKIRLTDTTNVWQVVHYHEIGQNPWATLFNVHFDGDTVVNSVSYKKMTPGYPFGQTISLFREDTVLNKVWCKIVGIDAMDSNEYVIYDGNWQVGDSIIRLKSGQRLSGYITGKDSVNMGGVWYKKFQVYADGTSAHAWDIVEGLGSSGGPVFAAFPYTFEDIWRIYCFSNKGTQPLLSPQLSTFGYAFDNAGSCVLNLSTKEAFVSAIRIYPNPAIDKITINTDETIGKADVNLYDITGRRILHQPLTKPNQTIKLDCHPGIYLLEIASQSGRKIFKLQVAR